MLKCTICAKEIKASKTNTEVVAHAEGKHPGKSLDECFPDAAKACADLKAKYVCDSSMQAWPARSLSLSLPLLLSLPLTLQPIFDQSPPFKQNRVDGTDKKKDDRGKNGGEKAKKLGKNDLAAMFAEEGIDTKKTGKK
jgi:hypothetical protein